MRHAERVRKPRVGEESMSERQSSEMVAICVIVNIQSWNTDIIRPLGYERVYLPLRKVADTPFHIQGDD